MRSSSEKVFLNINLLNNIKQFEPVKDSNYFSPTSILINQALSISYSEAEKLNIYNPIVYNNLNKDNIKYVIYWRERHKMPKDLYYWKLKWNKNK